MKKSKLSRGLVTGFVASLALAGCGSVSSKENSLLTFTGYDGSKYDIVTTDMYEEYRKDSSVISTFYDRVLEVLIRDNFANENSTLKPGIKYETIKELAEEDVKAAKAKASESAKNNGTSYDTEWDSILSGESVEDETELLEKYIYSQEKEALEDALYASLTTGAAGDVLKREWINGAHPYHIRHILAKVDSGASNYTRGTISADQAKRLADIGEALGLANDTFGGIAQRLSEDEGSAKLYGDVGLVTNKASTSGTFSMVTEFQLAIYIYDAIYRQIDPVNHIYQDLIPAQASLTFDKITRVPYQVFKLLASEEKGGFGDVTTAVDKKVVGEGEEAVYPRNILWNKYLNHHEPFIITNETVGDFSAAGAALTPEQIFAGAVADPNAVGVNSYEVNAQTDKGTGFIDGSILGLGNVKILADEKGNPIFGVRSEYGIHFIIIEKSAFESEDTLMDWYQVYSPKQAEYPSGLTSYVNYAGFDENTWSSRAGAVKDAVKGFDGTYQYRLFDKLVQDANGRFNFEDADAKLLLDEIKEYVALQKEKNAYDQSVGYELAWDNFIDKIEEQEQERNKYERIVPWGCAIGFSKRSSDYTADEKALYEIGGACYYGNKAK